MPKRINTITAGQGSIEAALALENEQSVVAPQALHADFPESGDATLADEDVIAISLGDGDDILTFDFPVTANFEVDANGGNDQINVSGGRNVHLNGGLGNDRLHLFNNGTASSRWMVVWATMF